jgi:hypothetical protein
LAEIRGDVRALAVEADLTLWNKSVQRATVAVLNAIYEEDFLGLSYGFRVCDACIFLDDRKTDSGSRSVAADVQIVREMLI